MNTIPFHGVTTSGPPSGSGTSVGEQLGDQDPVRGPRRARHRRTVRTATGRSCAASADRGRSLSSGAASSSTCQAAVSPLPRTRRNSCASSTSAVGSVADRRPPDPSRSSRLAAGPRSRRPPSPRGPGCVPGRRRGRRPGRPGSVPAARRARDRRRAGRRTRRAAARRSATPPLIPDSGESITLRTSSCAGDGTSPVASSAVDDLVREPPVGQRADRGPGGSPGR